MRKGEGNHVNVLLRILPECGTLPRTPDGESGAGSAALWRYAAPSPVTLQLLVWVRLVCLGMLLGATWTDPIMQVEHRRSAEPGASPARRGVGSGSRRPSEAGPVPTLRSCTVRTEEVSQGKLQAAAAAHGLRNAPSHARAPPCHRSRAPSASPDQPQARVTENRDWPVLGRARRWPYRTET
jgi:hypothetical protein